MEKETEVPPGNRSQEFVMFSSEKTKAFYGGGGGGRSNGGHSSSSAGNGGNGSSGGDGGGGASKSSYYVWFLGSREAKGLRGAEYIRPAVRHLLEYKTDACRKMTLQVSAKGMKMVQTPEKSCASAAVSKRRMMSASSSASPSDVIKQFVPHSSITCVTQGDAPNDDVVSCIVLLSSPDSDCPLYVHSYRDAIQCRWQHFIF